MFGMRWSLSGRSNDLGDHSNEIETQKEGKKAMREIVLGKALSFHIISLNCSMDFDVWGEIVDRKRDPFRLSNSPYSRSLESLLIQQSNCFALFNWPFSSLRTLAAIYIVNERRPFFVGGRRRSKRSNVGQHFHLIASARIFWNWIVAVTCCSAIVDAGHDSFLFVFNWRNIRSWFVRITQFECLRIHNFHSHGTIERTRNARRKDNGSDIFGCFQSFRCLFML